MRRYFELGVMAVLLATSANSCNNSVDADNQRKQEASLLEANRQAGIPNIVNFAEKKMLKALYELRDQQLPTYTYLRSANGEFKFFCNSIGFPIPYGAQYTNPQKYDSTGLSLPQAEPNGIFSPSTAEATFVLCGDGNGKIAPTYVEDRVTASPFKIKPNGEVDTSVKPTFSIPK